MANQLGIELLEIRIVDRAEPPHLAAPQVKHAPRAIELPGQIDRLPAGLGSAGIGEAGEDRGAGFRPAQRTVAIHAGKTGPGLAAGRGRVAQPEEIGLQSFAG